MKKVRLSVKLTVSFLSMALLLLAVGWLGIKGELEMRDHLFGIGQVRLPAIIQLDRLNIERLQIRAQTLEVQTRAVWSAQAIQVLERVAQQRATSWKNVEDALAQYEALPRTEDEKAIFEAFKADYRRWRASYGGLEQLLRDMIRTESQETYAPRHGAYVRAVNDSFLVSDRVGVLIESMVAVNNQSSGAEVEEALVEGRNMIRLTGTGIGLGLLLAAFLGVAMTRDTLRQLGGEPVYALSVVDRVAQGDLASEVELRKGDTSSLLAAFSRMVASVRGLLQEVSTASAQVAAAAQQLSVTSEEILKQVKVEQSETDQVATAMNEMTATVEEVARHAADAAKAAQETDGETASGGKVVTATISAIESLAQEVEAAGQVIGRLSDDSAEIGAVLDVIRGVAEQTNLLALNAAIEAARAGEQGRGFAVVAAEVRTLASRTQDSIQDIQEKIERVQSGSVGAVQVMERGQAKASEGVAQARLAGESFQTISDSITGISDMNRQIASAAEEQTAVAEEINRNIHTISGTVEQTSAGSTQTASAAEQLAGLAAQLQERVGQFKI